MEYEIFEYSGKKYAYIFGEGLNLLFTIIDDIPKWTIYEGKPINMYNLKTGELSTKDVSLKEVIENAHWVISSKPAHELVEIVNEALNCEYSQEDYVRAHRNSKQ